MGGKGRKRREKNYKAAHRGNNRLPPPPVPSSVDVLPSKLRKIMAFTHSPQPGSVNVSVGSKQRNRGKGDGDGGGDGVDKKFHSDNEFDFNATGVKKKGNDGMRRNMDQGNEAEKNSPHEKRKKKRKRKPVDDLRFEGELGAGSKRKEHKKKRLEAIKKKHKKFKAEENLDFPGHEEIKFGEVVEAPPKLVTIPKAMKSSQDASKERLRLQAVEAYRNRRGWASRPGIDLPPPRVTSPSL